MVTIHEADDGFLVEVQEKLANYQSGEMVRTGMVQIVRMRQSRIFPRYEINAMYKFLAEMFGFSR
jgi:hypothetical protein